MSEQVYIYSDDPQREEAFKFLKLLSDSIFESRHTPIVLDVYGEAVDLIIKRDATLKAQRDELLAALKRLGTSEAFTAYALGRKFDKEAVARMEYARAAIANAEKDNPEC